MRRLISLSLGLLAIGGIAMAAPMTRPADAPSATPSIAPAAATAAQPVAAPLTAEDLEPWLDGMIPVGMTRGKIAGMAIVVVKDGRILFQKGYGYADVTNRLKVDPARTLFRPGSVAKTFTWTAVMQLVEQGKLDLDRDVNDYLDFRIPHTHGKAVTIRMLMHHNAGFEEKLKGLFAHDVKSLKPLGQSLRDAIPNQIYPPGRFSAYSNYSTSLAGYIVERVSGEPFDDYMDRHIFAPLGMRHSTFRIPLQPALAPLLSKGYLLATDPPHPLELDQMRPAGSISASVEDMGRFMIAHLEQGRGLMRPETARMMHYGNDRLIPALNGFSYGFFQYERNGRLIIGHGGDSQYFFNEMRMFPNERVGIFIASNSAGTKEESYPVMEGVLDHFYDRYFPAPERNEKTAPTAAAHAAMMAGRYESSRHIESNFMSLVYTLAQQSEVIVNPDHTISVTGGGGFYGDDGAPTKWREIMPFVWRDVGSQDLLAAKVEKGRVVAFGTNDGGPTILWLPVPLHRSGALNMPLFFGGLAILLVALIAWPIAPIVRRRYGVPAPHSGRDAMLHLVSRLGALCSLVFIIGWGWVFMTGMNDLSQLNESIDPWIRLLQILGLLGGVGALATLVLASRMWATKRDWLARIGNSLLAAGQLAILWIGFAFHFISTSLSF